MTTTGAHGAVRFPVVSAQGVELETVQCILSPRERAKKAFVIHGPDPVEIERILGEARSTEQHENSAFSVNVRFVPNRFSDSSYSLALAIADKWARGCWPQLSERAVVIATGQLETGGAGVVGAIGHFTEKLEFMISTAPPDSWLVVPRLNIDALSQNERSVLEHRAEMAGIHLLPIQHLNELNTRWYTALAPPAQTRKRHSPNRKRFAVPALVLLMLSAAGVWGWYTFTQAEEAVYRLTGGSADRLWCATATLPEYLATWQLSNRQPPCVPQGGDREQTLIELLAQAEGKTELSTDQTLYTRYHALDTDWLDRLKRNASAPALELLHAFETRLQRVEQVRQQAVKLQRLARQLQQHNRYRDAQQLLLALSQLKPEVRQWLNRSEVDLAALEVDARRRMQQVEMQRVAVEYYWEKIQSGDLDVKGRFQSAAVALGRENWELLPEQIRMEMENF